METRLWGLNAAAHITQQKLSDYCSPAIYREGDRFVRGFGFENLLGAMWLQMFWALTGDEGPRCKNRDCRNPMPLVRIKGRGRPIEYCDKRCANRERYLLKTKDERRERRHAVAGS
jgi:hypothetical protein